MIDHVKLNLIKYAEARHFFQTSLAPLGYKVGYEVDETVCGLGVEGMPDLWLEAGEESSAPTHVAFTADTRAAVDKFYQAAIAAGGIDNGKPGLREHYHENYYAAFVLDPDGNNIEAVCHKPE